MTDADRTAALYDAYRWFRARFRDHGIARRLALLATAYWQHPEMRG